MIKKIAISIFLLCSIFSLFSENYQELMGIYIKNQHKVKTFVATGTISIEMCDKEGNSLGLTTSRINIYMKYPDLFKLVVKDPAELIMVQKGNLVTQKMGDAPAVTSKVDQGSDLFKKYFTYEIEDAIAQAKIKKQEVITEEGKKLYKFTLDANKEIPSNTGDTVSVDTIEIYFNENGMLVRQVMYSEGNEIIQTQTNYIEKYGIYLANRMSTEIYSGNMIIKNTITYNAISVNTVVSDKEFEL